MSDNHNKDLDKKKTMTILTEQLESQMKNIKDDLDVEHIKKILYDMDQIDPIVHSSKQDRTLNFTKDILPVANVEKKNLHSKLKKKKSNHQRFLVYRTACLALVTIFILNIGTVAFAGFNIFDTIISWTKEIFTIKNYSVEDKSLSLDYELGMNEYESLGELEKDLGFSLYKPSDEYMVSSISVDDVEQKTFITLTYQDSSENTINSMVTIYKNQFINRASYIEKNEDNATIRKENINGINFYVIKNTEWYSLTWLDGALEYIAFNFNDEDSAMKYAKSIYKNH